MPIEHRVSRRLARAALALAIGCAALGGAVGVDRESLAGGASGGLPAAICRAPAKLPDTVAEWSEGARLFAGLGRFHRKTSTQSTVAQAYFDQGMRYLWAFNHDEATRSFARAAAEDPACAMCFWGVALTVGPNYNLPTMVAARAKVAWEALQQAERRAAAAPPVEQALIAALAKRYAGPQALDPAAEMPVLTAYADAMADVAAHFPDDLDVQTLAAEAAMNTNAWKLWGLDGSPAPGTEAIVARLEVVLAKNPGHPGANHYYIHAVEASPHPEKALPAAARLAGVMPAAGHLVHMPAHILQRVGRYADAAEANRKAAAADIAYFTAVQAPDYYPVAYTGHNYQFLAYSAAMLGRKAETLAAARQSQAIAPAAMLLAMPGADWYVAELYMAMVRFGLWDDILAEPPPDERLKALTGGYLYAKATALAATGRTDAAKAALAALAQHAATFAADDGAGLNAARDVFAVAVLVVKARIATTENKPDEAIALLTDAVAHEDRLAYDEPADWFFPVRHLLGAALLKAGRADAAEAVYREDLRRYPANGWALSGLAQALAAQGRDAAPTRRQFTRAWALSDIKLTASAF
ncbi:MAG TPA: hypothetical protein VG651_15175 [Stellaceae bacterium]|nr:hypothetical protein [Stellaceae bacterium]